MLGAQPRERGQPSEGGEAVSWRGYLWGGDVALDLTMKKQM